MDANLLCRPTNGEIYYALYPISEEENKMTNYDGSIKSTQQSKQMKNGMLAVSHFMEITVHEKLSQLVLISHELVNTNSDRCVPFFICLDGRKPVSN